MDMNTTTPGSRILPAGDAALSAARDALAAGEIVAIPTETVYGLAADATNGEAVARIFAAKQRPSFNPLICHVTGIEMAESFAAFDPLSRRLAEAFWPGALTLVLPLKPGHAIHPLVTAGLDTVAVRAPKGFGAELIATLGRPPAGRRGLIALVDEAERGEFPHPRRHSRAGQPRQLSQLRPTEACVTPDQRIQLAHRPRGSRSVEGHSRSLTTSTYALQVLK